MDIVQLPSYISWFNLNMKLVLRNKNYVAMARDKHHHLVVTGLIWPWLSMDQSWAMEAFGNFLGMNSWS